MESYIKKGLGKLSRRLDLEFSYTVANHNFELGLPLENSLKNFFKQYFPLRYGFGTGYLVDRGDNLSNQCDWIIYDAIHFPPLITKTNIEDGVEFYPFEAAYAVVEVKRTLNQESLSKAIDQIAITKGLERPKTTGTQIHPLMDYESLFKSGITPQMLWTNTFTAGIYAYCSNGLENPADVLSILNEKPNFHLLPDFIAVHGMYYITKGQNYSNSQKDNGFNIPYIPQVYNGYGVIKSEGDTSGVFYARLLNQLNNTYLSARQYMDSLKNISSGYPIDDFILHRTRQKHRLPDR